MQSFYDGRTLAKSVTYSKAGLLKARLCCLKMSLLKGFKNFI